MVRQRGDKGFRRISWDAALDLLANRIRDTDPHKLAFYLTSRGITNEVYFVAQKVARFPGTNNVDNSSRVCHAPSTTALKQTLGVPASTCSYSDWIGTDLLVLIGSDIPNNQPVTTKYIYYAKQQGTKLTDCFFLIHTGGDIAFINGVLKHLLEQGWLDRSFIDAHTSGFEELQHTLEAQSWEILERYSGVSREEMLDFARLYA